MNNIENFQYPLPKQKYKVLVRCYTFNHSKYIEDALNGFAMQQTNFPFVCLVVDDASTDGEQEVIRKWMDRECEMSKAETINIPTSIVILVPHKSNASCTFAFYLLKQNLYRVKGAKKKHVDPWRERCEYEALCEGDDYWIDPLKLQKQANFLDKNLEYSAISSQSQMVYSSELTSKLFSRELKNRDYQIKEIIGSRPFHTATILYRNMNVLRERPSVFSGDALLFSSLSVLGKIHYSSKITGIYRKHSMGASSTCRLEQLKHDFNMIAYLKRLDPKYPVNKLKSYLYYTLARGPKDVTCKEKIQYSLKSIYYSFSYFPRNLIFICRLIYGVFIYKPFLQKNLS